MRLSNLHPEAGDDINYQASLSKLGRAAWPKWWCLGASRQTQDGVAKENAAGPHLCDRSW